MNRRSTGNPMPDQQVSSNHSQPPLSQANQVSTNLHNLNLTQQYINAALFNVNNNPKTGYFPRLVNPVPPLRSPPKPPSPVLMTPKQQVQLQHQLQQHAINMGTNSSDEIELHMAEKLLENAAQQQKNAFQFDTDTPNRGLKLFSSNKSPLSSPASPKSSPSLSSSSSSSTTSSDEKSDKIDATSSMLDSGIGLSEVQLRRKPQSKIEPHETEEIKGEDDLSNNSDYNGGFITPPGCGDKSSKQNQVKRATVVENPMFSSSPDSELINNPNESLGLDDLDMDYEQIMHYFDNLKVRRCNRRRQIHHNNA